MPTQPPMRTPPATAPAEPTPAPQAAPAPVPVADTVADPTPVATAPVPGPVPAPVKKPAPITAGKPPGPGRAPAAPTPGTAPFHATVTTLSRGKGVPPETREALKRIRALLEARQADAAVSEVQMQRIGLEGESRLCIEFRSAADAKTVLSEMRRIAAGADLLDIAETPCPYRKE